MAGIRDAKTAQMSVGFTRDDGRPDNDFYETPIEATSALLAVESFDGDIWEPACGDGAMSEVIKSYGHDVISTELRESGYGKGGVDFLATHKLKNPSLPHRFLELRPFERN